MQKGDKNQKDPPKTSEAIIETLWPIEALHTSHESSHDAGNYFDVVKVLSEVELPSPSHVLTTSGTFTRETNVTTFHEGQSSGTKRKADDIEVNNEREREQKGKQHDYRQPGHQRVATEIDSTTDKQRRNRISEKIRVLQALLPNCNKRDKASILGDAIERIKFLQMQIQMMQSMGVGPIPQAPYMFQARQPSLQEPNISPYFTTRPLINMQHGMPQFGSYAPINFPLYPQPFYGYPPLMPPMQFGNGSFVWQQPRPILYPQELQFSSHEFRPAYSTTPSSGTIIPTTCSEAEPIVPVQPSYNTPETSQKGDDDQHQQFPSSAEIPEYSSPTTSWLHAAPFMSMVNNNEGTDFTDIVKVLSHVELPSPSPVLATPCTSTREDNLITFHEGQSSGTKKDAEIKVNVEQQEREQKDKHENLEDPGKQFVASQTHNTDRRRRSQIHQRIRTLKELIPNCNKRDQASILDDTIEYVKYLQMQLQIMQCMGAGAMPQGLYMSQVNQQSLQVPYLAPYIMMRQMNEMGYHTGYYGSHFTPTFPMFPPCVSRFNTFIPPMEVGTGLPRFLPIPRQEFPSEPLHSATLPSDTVISTTTNHVGSGISSQSSPSMAVTIQETQQVSSANVKERPPKLFNDGSEDS